MRRLFVQGATIVLALFCIACGQGSAPPGPAAPSPTIAAAVRSPVPPQLSPTPAHPAAQPSPTPAGPAADATPGQAAYATAMAGGTPVPEPTIYLWPADLPPDLKVSPKESRVSGDSEVGPNGMGFYVVTLNAGAKKLVIGGGDLGEALPLSGAERAVKVGQRTGKLITNDQQRELVLDFARGKLFLYSLGYGEDELLRTAASLQPIDVRTLRELAAK